MKTSIRNLILAGVTGVSLAAASVALAGPGAGCNNGDGPGFSKSESGMMGHRHKHGARHGRGGQRGDFSPEERAAQHLDKLKTSLKLQADQEKSWSTLASTVEAQAKRMGELRKERTEAPRTAPERLEMASKFTQERARNLEEMSKAMKGLYDTLTPEQRAVLDNSRGRWMRG